MNRVRFATWTMVLVAVLADPRSALASDDPVYALKFDGVSDFVKLSTTGAMMASGWKTTKTVSLWVKPTGTATCTSPSPNACDLIFGDRPRAWGISRGTVNGNDRIWVWNYDGTVDSIAITYTVGEWIHVALVHGGGVLKAYKNGQLVGTVPSGATPDAAAQATLQFGGAINNSATNWTFAGEIDEVQLWNAARSDAEILQDANRLLTGFESGLVAYYQMSNGSGTTVSDNSGHQWTGTLSDGGSGVPADGPITWGPSGAFGYLAGPPPPPNNSPSVDPQNLLLQEDTPVAILLTGSDPENDPLTFSITTPPAHGTLTGSGANLLYTPAANFNGSDAFGFKAFDGHSDSAPQTVSLTVTPVNDSPVAVADSVQTQIDTAVTIAVLSNDTDVDADTLTITGVVDPSHGTLSYDLTQITYTPTGGYTGTDTFSYTITDDHGGYATTQVNVTIRAPGADPGYSLRFDGVSDFVQLPYTSYILPSGWQTTKTVEVWVKPTGTYACTFPSSPLTCDAIFGDRPRWWGITRGPYNGLDRIWVWNWDGNLDAIGIPYTVGQWAHIALVHTGGVLYAYKNGVLMGSINSGATQQPLNGALPVLQFGGVINAATTNWTLEGELDEVRIWGIARTAQEIIDNMSHPLGGSEAGLAAYYSMSDGSGTSLTDDSGHGWTGKLKDGIVNVPPDGPITWVPSGAFAP